MEELIDILLNRLDEVQDGEAKALPLLKDLKALEDVLKAVKDGVLEQAIEEFDDFGEKSVEMFGATFTKSQSGRYSYKHIPEWVTENTVLKGIEKDAQEAYKLSLKGRQLVTDDGTLVEPAEYKPNRESISVKIK